MSKVYTTTTFNDGLVYDLDFAQERIHHFDRIFTSWTNYFLYVGVLVINMFIHATLWFDSRLNN